MKSARPIVLFSILTANKQSYLLVRHPSVLSRLREEVSSNIGTEQTLTRNLIQKLPYLRCILNESMWPNLPPLLLSNEVSSRTILTTDNLYQLLALRLYPPVPVNLRTALNTTIWPRGGGADGMSPVLIRKGMGVGYSLYHMHRRQDVYGEDASSFRPERWEDGKLAEIGFAYGPFHGGPRICLGSKFPRRNSLFV